MEAKFYLLCTGSASPVSPVVLSTSLAHSLPEWNDCRVTIGSVEDNIIKVSRHGNLSKVCLLFKSRSMLCLSIDWAPANIQLRHKFKHVTSPSVTEFKTPDVEAGHAKLSTGASTQVLPCLQEKVGRCADIKRRGRVRWRERKHFSSQSNPRHNFCHLWLFSSDLKQDVSAVCTVKWEEGCIPSPGTVPQRGPPSDLVASEDASLGTGSPRSREGVNPQK